MKTATDSKPQTLGELKAYLAELEAAWSAEDVKYLGEFDNQTLHFAVPDTDVDRTYMQYHAEFSLVAVGRRVEAVTPKPQADTEFHRII
jgi:hypothetical protein